MRIKYADGWTPLTLWAIGANPLNAPDALRSAWHSARPEDRDQIAERIMGLLKSRFLVLAAGQTATTTRVLDLLSGEASISLDAVSRLFHGVTKANPDAGAPRAPGRISVAESWASDVTLPQVMGQDFRPDREVPIYLDESTGLTFRNLFRPPLWAIMRDAGLLDGGGTDLDVELDAAAPLAYIEELVPDQVQRDYLLGQIGFKLRNPAAVLPMPVFVCERHGSGRDTLLRFLSKLFGDENVRLDLPTSIFDPKSGNSRFTAFKAEAIVGYVAELAPAGSGEGHSRMDDMARDAAGAAVRSMINPGPIVHGQVQRKGAELGTKLLPMWLIAATNITDALHLDKHDRRVFVIENAVVSPRVQSMLLDAMNDSVVLAAFAQVVMSRALSDKEAFLAPPETKAKLQMVEGRQSDIDMAVRAAVYNRQLLPSPIATVSQVECAAILLYLTEHGAMPSAPELRRSRRVIRRILSGTSGNMDWDVRYMVRRATCWPLPSWVRKPSGYAENEGGQVDVWPLFRDERDRAMRVLGRSLPADDPDAAEVNKSNVLVKSWLDLNDAALMAVRQDAELLLEAAGVQFRGPGTKQ